jgi:hypothetical protein
MLEQRQHLEEQLQQEKFAAWLAERDDGRVGSARSGVDCPIARYLISLGYGGPYVDVDRITVAREQIEVPTWVGRFIYRADRLANNEPITKAEALRFLEDIS